MASIHRTFISYHHENDERYKLYFERIFQVITTRSSQRL